MRAPIVPVLALLVAISLAQGCASGGGPGSGGSGPVIDSDAIADVTASDAYEIVQNLRPRWLRSRGTISIQSQAAGYPVVYVDGMSYGDLSTLRQISAVSVQRIEFIGASDATTRFGTGHPGGVIMVTTRR